MHRGILIFGSIIAVVILILASFPSVVSAESMESTSMRDSLLSKVRNMDNWEPGDLLKIILLLLAYPEVLFALIASVLLYLRWLFFGIPWT